MFLFTVLKSKDYLYCLKNKRDLVHNVGIKILIIDP